MSIKVERNNNGNCVIFRGQTNPVYWNACLTAEIVDTDFVNIVNNIASDPGAGKTQYEFYRIHFSEWLDAEDNYFTSAADVVTYINTIANTVNITRSFGPTATDIINFSLNATGTGLLVSTGDSFVLGGVRAVANDFGRVDIRQHSGDVVVYYDVPIANFELNSTPVTGTVTEVVDAINAFLQGEVNLFSAPDLTSVPSVVNLVQGEQLNFRVNLDPAMPVALEFEWQNVPAGVFVSETYRGRLVGSPTGGVGTYTVTLTAFNSFGTTSKDIDIVVAAATGFDNTQSVLLEANYWLESDAADALALDAALGGWTPWTVSFWWKPNTNGNRWQNIVVFGQDLDTDSRVNIAWDGRNDRIMLRMGEVVSNYTLLRTGSNTMTPSVWHHVAVTFNGVTTWNTSNVELFVDGSAVPLITEDDQGAVPPQVDGLRVGRCLNNNDPLRGSPVDELAIWNSELTPAQVTSIYNSGTPISLAPLSPTFWWRMGDGDTFPTIADATVSGVDLTLVNATAAAIITDTP